MISGDEAQKLHRDVWNLAWPSVTTMLLQTVNSLLDVFFVGHLEHSKQALAATGVGGQVLFLLISLAMGISVGTTALVARFTGAKDEASSVEATGQSLTLGAILGVVCFVFFFAGRRTMVGWMLGGQHDPLAERLCVQFLEMVLLSTVPMFVLNVLMGMFRGLGDTRTPLLIQFVMVGTHIALNVVLIYGLLGFPRLGVRGAGIALTASVFVGVALYLWAMVKRTLLAHALRWSALRPHADWAWRILKIGIPAAIQAVIRSLSMMSFTGMLAYAADGSAGVAALQIGMRAEALAFMPGFGYSVAAAALVGQSLGARDVKRAEQCGWAATLQAILVMSTMAVLFFTFADPISRTFTKDPAVQSLGADYLRINAFCEPFLAMGMVLTGALQGAGDTLRPTYITFFTMWVVRMPVAWWLMFPLHLNTHGAWLSMTTATTLGGLMSVALFRSGRWKQIKV